jgi:ABC-type antimicrobial peptide transport system ATPase subunit
MSTDKIRYKPQKVRKQQQQRYGAGANVILKPVVIVSRHSNPQKPLSAQRKR